MYYSGKSADFNLNSEKLPIFDFYTSLKTDWCYEYRHSKRCYTGLQYKYYCVQVIIFRKAYTWSAEYNRETICPIEAKFLANEQKKKRLK